MCGMTMQEKHRNKYLLEGLTMGEWWDIVDAERLCEEKRGLSCVVEVAQAHRLRDMEYSTPNFLCCLSHGLGEVTFVHSLDQIAFSVKKSSTVKLMGDHILVEGHKIRFYDLPNGL